MKRQKAQLSVHVGRRIWQDWVTVSSESHAMVGVGCRGKT